MIPDPASDVDTEEIDLLQLILQELRDMRCERVERDKQLDARIGRLEKELELVRVEQQNQGIRLGEMELQCRRRLAVCQGRVDGKGAGNACTEWTSQVGEQSAVEEKDL
jgi:hypothetical protein